jgi:hypothetical protein
MARYSMHVDEVLTTGVVFTLAEPPLFREITKK